MLNDHYHSVYLSAMLLSTGGMDASSSTGKRVPPLNDLRRDGMGALSGGFEDLPQCMLGDAMKSRFFTVNFLVDS